jgi:hypothetical protein
LLHGGFVFLLDPYAQRMLDLVLLAKVVLVGALGAAAVMGLAAWGTPGPWRRSACWSWAIGAGVLAAGGTLHEWPHWPPLEDRARFLTLLVPLTMVVEGLAVRIPSRGRALVLRFALAAAAAPILLYNSVYLADLNGPGSAKWSLGTATLVLSGLVVLVALMWILFDRLERRSSTRAVQSVLALDALATAFTVMMSGYYRGGLLGLGLAGAIAGARLASYITQPQSTTGGSLAMSVVGIFAVVLMGRFFGALSTGLSAVLLLAPLLAWVVELPRLRKFSPSWRAVGRWTCVTIPLLVVLVIAERKFTAAFAARSRPAETGTASDPIDK